MVLAVLEQFTGSKYFVENNEKEESTEILKNNGDQPRSQPGARGGLAPPKIGQAPPEIFQNFPEIFAKTATVQEGKKYKTHKTLLIL